MRSFFGWATVLAIGLSVALAAGATAAPVKPKVKVLTSSQSAVITKGVKVRVSGRPGSRVRISFQSRSFDEGARNLAKPRSIRLGRSGRRVINVGLTPNARRAAGTCSARALVAIAKSGKRRATAARSMVRNLPDCRLQPIDASRASTCEFIAQPQQGLCMLPFPSDFYTRPDRTSPTGKRISFDRDAMPRNEFDKPIGVEPYAWSDGFSQGQGIVLKVPGLDTPEAFAQNDFVELDRLSRYTEADQKAVVIDAKTGKRWPIWVQLDSTATTPEDTALMISPSVNFTQKGRYIVVLRNLVDADGNAIEAPNAFRYYRDAVPSRQRPVNERRRHFEGIFKTLRKAKIRRSDLYLAWDFTVASNQNNYRRALYMRDEAFKDLGDTTLADQIVQGDAPEFTVNNQPTDELGPSIARQITGTFTVPCFLKPDCSSGGKMDLNAQGLPQENGTYQAIFKCIIPPVGLNGPNPPKLRPIVYGHGLLGDSQEVYFSPVTKGLAQNYNSIVCATNEIGMDFLDRVIVVPRTLLDMNEFSKLADRLQQGLLNGLYLARLMYHPDGLGSDPAFQNGDGVTPGESVIKTDDVYYAGASQGGIMGGALTALSPDFIQSALVVGGMNYSTLLTRSSNWDSFSTLFNKGYPDELSRPLVLNIVQMLWDRGEPNGYAHVTTDNPPPNTPAHNVTLQLGVGDHQVSNFTSDVMARTYGMKTNAGGIDDRRWPDYEDLWNIDRIKPSEYPYRGDSIIYWDAGPYRLNPNNLSQRIGTGPPPYGNLPPNDEWEDPHPAPRGAEGPIAMMNTFLQPNGYIEDACAGAPCVGSGWDGDYDSIIPVP